MAALMDSPLDGRGGDLLDVDPDIRKNVHFRLGYLIGAANHALKQMEQSQAAFEGYKAPPPPELSVAIRSLRRALNVADLVPASAAAEVR